MDKKLMMDKAKEFRNRWKSRAGNEQQEAQQFQREFYEIFGLEYEVDFTFERKVKKYDGNIGRIDGFVPSRLLVEMKSSWVNKKKELDEAFEQAEEYLNCLDNESEIPRYILVCNFKKFMLYDMSLTSANEPVVFTLDKIPHAIKYFDFLTDELNKFTPSQELTLNQKASYMMGRLYDEFLSSGYNIHELPRYLVRLLFCMFAEDTGAFYPDQFRNYILASTSANLGDRLRALFEILDMSPSEREKQTWLTKDLASFQYINGGLFHERLTTAHFSEGMWNTLTKCCEFDWSQIKPEIFGALFQAVMNKEERHNLGAHYTSEQNILKCLKPLFLDELRSEFNQIKSNKNALSMFYEKLHNLKFFDPACGCGNFLIVAYRELRELEIDVLKSMRDDLHQTVFDITTICQVNVDQFYGIEIEEFPCQIAQVGMWLCDHLMNLKASEIFRGNQVRLPLTKSARIIHGDAITLKWEEEFPDVNFIMSNPPYLGYSKFHGKEKDDFLKVMVNQKGEELYRAGKMDYVSAWFYKAAQYMHTHPTVHTALVATNSVTQGEQVYPLWEPLYELFNIEIEFGYRTFVWKNGAKGEAKVHCVIIGFCNKNDARETRIIFDENNKPSNHKRITPYLSDYPNILVKPTETPLCNVPKIRDGNRKADNGALVIKEIEYADFIKNDPLSIKYIKRLVGGKDYLQGKIRYCLWLVGAEPSEVQKMPEVMKRIRQCKINRENGAPDRQKLAKTPMLFREQMNPDSFIVVPGTSSEKRKWIPMGFLGSDTIPDNSVKIIIDGDLYLLGILMSNMHNAWMRYVCGRMKSDYSYSIGVVYNNFPFPQNPSDSQIEEIKRLAQNVLDARAQHPNSTLDALYSSETIPSDLLKAHEKLDKAVEKLYGRKFVDDRDIVIYLLHEYQKLSGVKEL